ncbi:MAG: hotdog fold thioesterase [Schleiferiaceae bacterium]|nr:hotdog fold thioesterase [Schleiferiaceae bacterium]
MSLLSPKEIVEKMIDQDAFSQWLGIRILSVSKGGCSIEMTVREEMVNGFRVAHGGITYSLADSALAFASNSHGQHALSIETAISHTSPVLPGDQLVAIAKELQSGQRLARYEVTVQRNYKTVALFKGTVFKNDTPWT